MHSGLKTDPAIGHIMVWWKDFAIRKAWSAPCSARGSWLHDQSPNFNQTGVSCVWGWRWAPHSAVSFDSAISSKKDGSILIRGFWVSQE